jgi:hypothetical protein
VKESAGLSVEAASTSSSKFEPPSPESRDDPKKSMVFCQNN